MGKVACDTGVAGVPTAAKIPAVASVPDVVAAHNAPVASASACCLCCC
jgi:hypothetical protein